MSISSNERDIYDAIETKLEVYLKKELGEDEVEFYVDAWVKESEIVHL